MVGLGVGGTGGSGGGGGGGGKGLEVDFKQPKPGGYDMTLGVFFCLGGGKVEKMGVSAQANARTAPTSTSCRI